MIGINKAFFFHPALLPCLLTPVIYDRERRIIISFTAAQIYWYVPVYARER